MTDDPLAEFLAALRSGGVLEDVMECVRRTRRTPDFWRMLRQDLEESERRRMAGCARYEVHHGADGMVGLVKGGVERKTMALEKKSALALVPPLTVPTT